MLQIRALLEPSLAVIYQQATDTSVLKSTAWEMLDYRDSEGNAVKVDRKRKRKEEFIWQPKGHRILLRAFLGERCTASLVGHGGDNEDNQI